METALTFIGITISRQTLQWYHIGEEILVGMIGLAIAWRTFSLFRSPNNNINRQKRARFFLLGAGFFILALSSFIHATIHGLHLNLNLLYQTLIGYCFGLLIIIMAISAEYPDNKKIYPVFYLPLLLLLHPSVYVKFPFFGVFRPLVWILVAYLSGVVCMLYIGTFYRTASKQFLASSLGHLLICGSAVFLFFPTGIGSTAWLHGHIMRPIGFSILFFSMNRGELLKMEGSILYRALAAFTLLAAIPLLTFGTFIFYDNISPITIIGRRFMIFLLLLVTLVSALFFGFGLIIRLLKPIIQLKSSVDGLGDESLDKQIPVHGSDEIGELSTAFNEMVVRLSHAIREQEKMSQLAATGELAATLAHEIKNPLNAIGGAADYIGKNSRGALIKEFISVISGEVGRINKLTTTLLGFAKPIRPDPQANDLNKLLQDALYLLEQETTESKVTIQTDLGGHLPLVNCDFNQIKQVVINLLINATDAVGPNGTIKITTRNDRDNIYLAVIDDGPGIPEKNLKKIFNPFFTTKTRGTGLGLAISRKIANENNGDLTVSSVMGSGSTFTLRLSLEEVEDAVSNFAG